MIDLAAGAWGISQQAAMRKLAQDGVPIPLELLDDNSEYSFGRVKRRRQAYDLWRRSNLQLDALTTTSVTVRTLRERLGLSSRVGLDLWRNGPGKMFGAATQAQLQEALLPPGAANEMRRNNGGLIFREAGWRDVLVFPYFSAPENLEGFQFVGREGGKADRRYRPVLPREGIGYQEGGLFGLATVDAAKHFAGQVFAMDDAVLAAKLQVRHASHSTTPLPLVAWYDRERIRTNTAWFAVERPLIFWGYRMTAGLVANAVLCDGRIAIVPLTEVTQHAIDHHLRSATPDELFRRALRQAKPWREALSVWAKERGHAAVEDLLLNLHTYSVDPSTISDVLDAPQVSRKIPLRHVTIGDYAYIERSSGWYRTTLTRDVKRFLRTGEERPISDTIIRLDYVSSGRFPRYVGRLIQGDRTVPFNCLMSKFRTIRRICVQSGLGVPTFRAPPMTLEQVAIAFQPPQLVSPESIEALVGPPVVRKPDAADTQSGVPVE